MSLVKDAEFYGMSSPAAAIEVLRKVGNRHALKTAVLVVAVRKGGVPVKDAPTLYRSMIRNSRLKKVGKGLWGLSEWYPKDAPTPATVTPATTALVDDEEPESEERPDQAAS